MDTNTNTTTQKESQFRSLIAGAGGDITALKGIRMSAFLALPRETIHKALTSAQLPSPLLSLGNLLEFYDIHKPQQEAVTTTELDFDSVIEGIAELKGIRLGAFLALSREVLEAALNYLPLPALGNLLEFYDVHKRQKTNKRNISAELKEDEFQQKRIKSSSDRKESSKEGLFTAAADARDSRVELTIDDFMQPEEAYTLQTIEPTFVCEEGWLGETVDSILRQLNKFDDVVNRVPLTALVRCSRGGKTRTLLEVGNLIKSKGIIVLYVSFNGDTTYDSDEELDPLQALCIRIAFSAFRDKSNPALKSFKDFRKRFKVNPRTIIQWLADKPRLLLLDELNTVGLKSAAFYDYLKENFLKQSGHYFVFSCHWNQVVGDISDALGKHTNSIRGLNPIPLPLINTSNLAQSLKALGCPTLPLEVIHFYGTIPAIMYTFLGTKNEITSIPKIYHVLNKLNLTNEIILEFLRSFIDGGRVHPELEKFMDSDTVAERGYLVKSINRWIPIFADIILEKMLGFNGVPKDVYTCMSLVHGEFQKWFSSKEGSGQFWESVVAIVIAVRLLLKMFPVPGLPLDYYKFSNAGFSVNSFESEQVRFGECKTLKQLIENVPVPTIFPHVALYVPTHAQFENFDVFVIAFESAEVKTVYAWQCKTGSPSPKTALDEGAGYLYFMKGKPAVNPIKPFNKGWEVLDAAQLKKFCGRTASLWIPHELEGSWA